MINYFLKQLPHDKCTCSLFSMSEAFFLEPHECGNFFAPNQTNITVAEEPRFCCSTSDLICTTPLNCRLQPGSMQSTRVSRHEAAEIRATGLISLWSVKWCMKNVWCQRRRAGLNDATRSNIIASHHYRRWILNFPYYFLCPLK